MRILLLTVTIICSLAWGQEQLQDSIRKDIGKKNFQKTLSARTASPYGIEKQEKWIGVNSETAVSLYVLEKNSGSTITAYVCQAEHKYWIRLQGTILNVDLWYGPYSINFRGQIHKGILQNNLTEQFKNELPALTPVGLEKRMVYTCRQHSKDLNFFEIPAHNYPHFGAEQISVFHCSEGRQYWVKIKYYGGFEQWYGPFSIPTPAPVVKLETSLGLEKTHFNEGEVIRVRVWLHNRTAQGVWVKFTSAAAADYEIDGAYRWSDGRMSAQVVQQKYIEPYGKAKLLDHRHQSMDYYLTEGNHSIVGKVYTRNYGTITGSPVTFQVLSYFPTKPVNELIEEANRYIREKKYRKARKTLKRAIKQDSDNNIIYYNLACVESLTYNPEQALTYFEKCLQLGFDDFNHIASDSDLDNIRHYPRFIELIDYYSMNDE